MDPTVTVLMPLLEAEPFLLGAIESVLAQTLRDFEFLIVAPDEVGVDRELSETDPRLRSLSGNLSGTAQALDVGIRAARGKFIARMEPRDICSPDRLRRQVELLEEDPRLVIVGSSWEWIDENGTITSARETPPRRDAAIRWRALFAPAFASSSVMFRSSATRMGNVRWDQPVPTRAFDYFFCSDLLRHGTGANLTSPLVQIRYRSGELVESPENVAAYAEVALKNLADLGVEVSRKDFPKLCELALCTPERLDYDDFELASTLVETLVAFQRQPGIDAADANWIANRVVDRVFWRAVRSDPRGCWKSGLAKEVLSGHPPSIVAAQRGRLARRARLAARRARREAEGARRYVKTLPWRNPGCLVGRGDYILLLSHMRSFSTLLAHVLASNPEVAGHTELGLAYRWPVELSRARAALSPEECRRRFALDKVLHDEFPVLPPVLSSERTYAIFLVRRPEPTIESVLKIRDPAGPRPSWYRDPNLAVDYYAKRLASLSQLAAATPDRARMAFLRSEKLIGQSDDVLAELTRHLGLRNLLSSTYTVFGDTGVWGAGDTSERIRIGRIERPAVGGATAVPVPESVLERARQAYDAATSILSDCCTELQ